jgi:hypothetical protein
MTEVEGVKMLASTDERFALVIPCQFASDPVSMLDCGVRGGGG